jgi:hypothetical protein
MLLLLLLAQRFYFSGVCLNACCYESILSWNYLQGEATDPAVLTQATIFEEASNSLEFKLTSFEPFEVIMFLFLVFSANHIWQS